MTLPKPHLVLLALAFLATGAAHAQSSPVFDGTNADLWLVDPGDGRVTGYDLGDWLEQFAPNNTPIFPLQREQQALINVLENSSQPMTPGQPAISIAGIDAGLDGNNPDGHPPLLVLPGSGDYGQTIALEMRVDTELMAADRPTLNWTINGNAESLLLSQGLLGKPGAPLTNGYYSVTRFLARDGAYTVNVTLTEPGATSGSTVTVASETRSYTLAAIDPDGEGRDTDGDGIPDVIEAEIGLDPFEDDWLVDADGDGWSEFDAWLRQPCLDPATRTVQAASDCLDADGKPVDSDADGWSDFDEILRGTNHLDPEPVLADTAQSQATQAGKETPPAQFQPAPTSIESALFCTDGSTFYFDLRFHADADDETGYDIVLGVGADYFPFQSPNHSIRVNFGEQGQVTRQEPVVRTSSSDTETPLIRWQEGPIADFNIESVGVQDWHVYGSVPVGPDPLQPGDIVESFALRSFISGNRTGGNYVVSGNPADCDTAAPPPSAAPTGLRYKDFPSARRLYEIEKIVTGGLADSATEPLPARKVEALTVFGQATYSTDELLTAAEIASVGLDPADIADRLEAAVAATAIANRQLPLMRLPAAESNVITAAHRPLTQPADYSRIYKLWVGQLPDASPADFFAQAGPASYADADAWRDAFVAYLASTLTVDVPAAALDAASTRVVSLVEGALSQESRLTDRRATQLFNTSFSAVNGEFVESFVEALRRFGGPGHTLDDTAAQLDSLSQAAQPLAALGSWIDARFLEAEPGTRSDAWIASQLSQSFDSGCVIDSSVVAELQQDPEAWAEFLERCPDYVTEVELPDILLADQARRHRLRTALLPGAAAAIAADATLLEYAPDSDADNRANTLEVDRPMPRVTLPWVADTDGDLVLDGDDPCPVDPFNECSADPLLPGIRLGADVFVSEPLSGSGIAIVTVVLDRVSDVDITIDYRAFVDATDSAADGADFTAVTGSVVIPAGERVAIVTVPVLADTEDEGAETFSVEITGVSGAVVADDGIIVVTINDPVATNSPPVFTSAGAISVPEGSTATGYSATATDADLDTLTYGIAGGADQSAFTIDPATGALSFASAPAFASPADADTNNVYEVQLGVSDGRGGADTLDLAVTVTELVTPDIMLAVTYPTPGANLGGEPAATTVAGRIIDPAGDPIDPAEIDFVDVAGVLATIDAADPSRWSAVVPVGLGDISLPITLARADGTTENHTLDIRNFRILNAFEDIAVDAAAGRVFAVNSFDGIYAIDLDTGEASAVSTLDTGSGPALDSPRDVAVDAANNRLLVTDSGLNALFAVDITTGVRTILSDGSTGTGVFPNRPQSVTLGSPGNVAYIGTSNITNDLIIAVDLATGDRTNISGAGTGTGPTIENLKDLVLDATNERILVVDSSLDQLLAVDLATGDRTVISGGTTGSGIAFSLPEAVALDSANNTALVADSLRGLIAVDLATGSRTVITSPAADYGPNASTLYGVAYDTTSGLAYLSDNVVDVVWEVDVVAGTRSVLNENTAGTVSDTAVLAGIQGLAYDPAGARVIIPDSYKKVLWSFDTFLGHRSPVSSDTLGAGPLIDFPGKAAVDIVDNEVYFVEQNRDALTVADLATGNRIDVSGGVVGAGPAFQQVADVALDLAANRALVADFGADAVFSVDLATGDRTIVSDSATGTGPTFSQPASIAFDASGDRGLVMDWATDALVGVDLASGDRTVLSDNAGVGAGPLFSVPFDMEFDPDNNRALVTDYGTNTLLSVDLTSGDRTVLVSSSTTPLGISRPYYVALDADNRRAFVYDLIRSALIVVDLTSGEVAVAAK